MIVEAFIFQGRLAGWRLRIKVQSKSKGSLWQNLFLLEEVGLCSIKVFN